MLKQDCGMCKTVGIIAIIGALNWGVIGLTGNNVVEGIFGVGTGITRIVYILIGISGLGLLASLFGLCKKCKN